MSTRNMFVAALLTIPSTFIFIGGRSAVAVEPTEDNFLATMSLTSIDGRMNVSCDVRTDVVARYDHTRPGGPTHHHTRFTPELPNAQVARAFFKEIERRSRDEVQSHPMRAIDRFNLSVSSGHTLLTQNGPSPRAQFEGLISTVGRENIIYTSLRFAEANCNFRPNSLVKLVRESLN